MRLRVPLLHLGVAQRLDVADETVQPFGNEGTQQLLDVNAPNVQPFDMERNNLPAALVRTATSALIPAGRCRGVASVTEVCIQPLPDYRMAVAFLHISVARRRAIAVLQCHGSSSTVARGCAMYRCYSGRGSSSTVARCTSRRARARARKDGCGCIQLQLSKSECKKADVPNAIPQRWCFSVGNANNLTKT